LDAPYSGYSDIHESQCGEIQGTVLPQNPEPFRNCAVRRNVETQKETMLCAGFGRAIRWNIGHFGGARGHGKDDQHAQYTGDNRNAPDYASVTILDVHRIAFSYQRPYP
jgi:hypothetical protein